MLYQIPNSTMGSKNIEGSLLLSRHSCVFSLSFSTSINGGTTRQSIRFVRYAISLWCSFLVSSVKEEDILEMIKDLTLLRRTINKYFFLHSSRDERERVGSGFVLWVDGIFMTSGHNFRSILGYIIPTIFIISGMLRAHSTR